MIIANEFVKINSNKKNITLKNYIFNEYLKCVNQKQFLNYSYSGTNTFMAIVALKLDELISDVENSARADYELYTEYVSFSCDGSSQLINATYKYTSDNGMKDQSGNTVSINDYAGRKIVQLVFFGFNSTKPFAYLDLTNYEINITANEHLRIERQDTFKTNMECVGIDYPVHIAPHNIIAISSSSDVSGDIARAVLYSVGFGREKGVMDYEYLLDDVDLTVNDTNFEISINNGGQNKLYPSNSNMPSSSKYPLIGNSQYVILKYRIYEVNSGTGTNIYYTMNLKNDYVGTFLVRSRVERGK